MDCAKKERGARHRDDPPLHPPHPPHQHARDGAAAAPHTSIRWGGALPEIAGARLNGSEMGARTRGRQGGRGIRPYVRGRGAEVRRALRHAGVYVTVGGTRVGAHCVERDGGRSRLADTTRPECARVFFWEEGGRTVERWRGLPMWIN